SSPMDGGASRGIPGGGLPPRPALAPTRRRAFIAPHPRPTSAPVDTNLSRTQERPSPSGGGGSGLPPRLCNDPPRLGPRALTFMEPHAGTWNANSSTWDAGSTTSSPAQTHVYEVADDDFSQIHWTPEYSDTTPSNGGKSKRGSNYNNLEDIQLCKSWINISNDPIIGNQQSGKTYWERIANHFHTNRDFDSDRTPNSLEHRFGIILKECMKFHGYYEEVERRHPSGIPYQEHLLEAQARYARKSNGKNCQFEHCWLTLRHTQKFESTLQGNKGPAKSRDVNLPVRSEQEDDDSTTRGQQSSSLPSAKKARPPGRKQSKEKLKTMKEMTSTRK
ncbi:hypothetical protein BDA96_04G333200, partial [Sorghum bicolor]